MLHEELDMVVLSGRIEVSVPLQSSKYIAASISLNKVAAEQLF